MRCSFLRPVPTGPLGGAIELTSRSIYVSLRTVLPFVSFSDLPSPALPPELAPHSSILLPRLSVWPTSPGSAASFAPVLVKVASRRLDPWFPITVKVQFIPRLIDRLRRNPFPFSSLSFAPARPPASAQPRRKVNNRGALLDVIAHGKGAICVSPGREPVFTRFPSFRILEYYFL